MVARLSNLSLKLYSWYIKHGHARNEQDEKAIRQFMKDNLPPDAWEQTGFYEKLYLYQSYSWHAYIRQDFVMYYKYSQKWVNLFHEQPLMKRVETGHYIKALHNLLNAHFDLRNGDRLAETLTEFEGFAQTERVQENDNFRIQSFIYIAQANINRHFLMGTFSKGLELVPGIEEKLTEYSLFIDRHRALVLNYKIATLHFGSGDYGTCIDYLQKIINDHVDLRYDIQCYARLLHLLAHYELGNHELLEYLTKSVYRFMSKMENLTMVEEEMIKFLRRAYHIPRHQVKAELEKFLHTIKQLEKKRFQTRVFVYLDIISWIEHKVYNRPLSDVVSEKANLAHKRGRISPASSLAS
jgi:hypothetical protein